jgi:hypothetical protein
MVQAMSFRRTTSNHQGAIMRHMGISDKTYPTFDILVYLISGGKAFAKRSRKATADQILVLM